MGFNVGRKDWGKNTTRIPQGFSISSNQVAVRLVLWKESLSPLRYDVFSVLTCVARLLFFFPRHMHASSPVWSSARNWILSIRSNRLAFSASTRVKNVVAEHVSCVICPIWATISIYGPIYVSSSTKSSSGHSVAVHFASKSFAQSRFISVACVRCI